MKKLMTLMLGLSIALGSVAVVFAQDTTATVKKEKKMKKLIVILAVVLGISSLPCLAARPASDANMILIPAGTFQMGDSLDGDSDALPVQSFPRGG